MRIENGGNGYKPGTPDETEPLYSHWPQKRKNDEKAKNDNDWQPVRLSRREFVVLAAAGAAGAVSCGGIVVMAGILVRSGENPTSTPHPAVPVPTDIPTQVQPPERETQSTSPTPEPQPTELPYSASDKSNYEKLRNADSGDAVELEDIGVSMIVRINRPGADAYYAVLARETEKGIENYAILENADCLVTLLQENNLLGEEVRNTAFGRVYTPKVRLSAMKTTVFLQSLGNAWPVATLNELTPNANQEPVDCPKQSMFSNLDARLAKAAGKAARDIIQGFSEGFDVN